MNQQKLLLPLSLLLLQMGGAVGRRSMCVLCFVFHYAVALLLLLHFMAALVCFFCFVGRAGGGGGSGGGRYGCGHFCCC